MIIKKYNVTLRRLEESDLELVRLKRNSPAIRTRMFYQEEITPDAQNEWFQKINDAMHYYFVIEAKGQRVGLINGNIRDFESKTIDAGIFIWDEAFLATRTAVASAICVLDFHFMLMEMQQVYIEVRSDNWKAIAFNQYLGFKQKEIEKEIGRVWLHLEKENYLKHTEKLRRGIMRAARESSPLSWSDVTATPSDRSMIEGLPERIYQAVLPRIPVYLRR